MTCKWLSIEYPLPKSVVKDLKDNISEAAINVKKAEVSTAGIRPAFFGPRKAYADCLTARAIIIPVPKMYSSIPPHSTEGNLL